MAGCGAAWLVAQSSGLKRSNHFPALRRPVRLVVYPAMRWRGFTERHFMTLTIQNTISGQVQQFNSLSDVPMRHRWAFDQIIMGERNTLASGSTVYELRESCEVSDKYDFVN